MEKGLRVLGRGNLGEHPEASAGCVGSPLFVNSISCFLMSSIKWLSATVPGFRFGDVAVVTGYELLREDENIPGRIS